MSDNTDQGNGSPEDSEVIRGLREQLKTANKAVKTAGDDAVAKVKRSATASSLLPDGYKGLADIYEAEVDGELDAESAAEWLKTRGFTASSDEGAEEVVDTATELEEVTDLGGAVAAAGSLTPENTIQKQLDAVITPDKYQSLSDVVAGVDAVLNG